MARKLASDKILFGALVALSFFGCVMIYSASAVPSARAGGSPYRYLARQLLALVVGGVAAFALYRIDYRHLRRKPVVYALLAGAIVTETIFSWPGIGLALWTAIDQRDYPMLQGGFLVLAISVVLLNLLTDLAYSRLDPRIGE